MDALVLHGLHGNGTVQGQRTGHHAAGNTALGDFGGGHGGGHLLRDVFHGGENRHLGQLHAQGIGHRQSVLYNADLGIHVGGNVDGGVGDHHKAAFILENAALAHQTAAAGGDQTGLPVQNGLGKAGGLENALHGDVRLPLAHQLHGGLGGVQLRAVKVHDLIFGGILVHLLQQGQDLVLLAQQGAIHHAPAMGVDHGAEGGLVVGVGQNDALFVFMRQDIRFQFLKIREHIRSSYLTFPFGSHFTGNKTIIQPLFGKNNQKCGIFLCHAGEKSLLSVGISCILYYNKEGLL